MDKLLGTKCPLSVLGKKQMQVSSVAQAQWLVLMKSQLQDWGSKER